jgi:hypothetical protein
MPLDEPGVTATLLAYHALLSALASTHPQPKLLYERFSVLISRVIEQTDDPQVAGKLQAFEEAIRALLRP